MSEEDVFDVAEKYGKYEGDCVLNQRNAKIIFPRDNDSHGQLEK